MAPRISSRKPSATSRGVRSLWAAPRAASPPRRYGLRVAQEELARQQVRPPARIGRGPVHLGLESRDRPIPEPERAVAGLAAREGLELPGVERELPEVVDRRRGADLPGEPEIGGLPEAFDVPDPADEPLLVVGNPDRAEHGHLRALDRQGLRHDLAAAQLLEVGGRKTEPLGQNALGARDLGHAPGGRHDGEPAGQEPDAGGAPHAPSMCGGTITRLAGEGHRGRDSSRVLGAPGSCTKLGAAGPYCTQPPPRAR